MCESAPVLRVARSEDSEPLLRPRRGADRSPLGGQHSASLSPMVLRLRRLGSLDNMAADRPRERDRPPDDSRAKVDQIHDQVSDRSSVHPLRGRGKVDSGAVQKDGT